MLITFKNIVIFCMEFLLASGVGIPSVIRNIGISLLSIAGQWTNTPADVHCTYN